MKTLKTIIFASAALLAAAACTKEANPKEESVPSAPGTIEVNVTALIGDLAPSEGTKATMAPVIRLTWENNDKVYAYDAQKNLGYLTVTPASDGLSAKLTGTLTEKPADGTTKITLVYCTGTTPTMTDNKLSFDLRTQNDEAANPFVVYATLDYTTGLTSITNKIVPFTFATSLMRVTVTGLANESITEATVSGVNTACELAVSATGEPTVSGTTPGTITRAAAGITKSDDGRAVFNVSVAAETENANRKLTIKQGDLIYGSDLMSKVIAAGQSIISVYALTEQTGSRGTIGIHDYVYVAGKKWATQNLAIYSPGKGAWIPGGSTVKVPCSLSEENVVVGDYFQWGVYPGYCGDATAPDKGLLIYKSFSYKQWYNSYDLFTFKTFSESNITYYYRFSTYTSTEPNNTIVGISPYYSSSYTRYNISDKDYRPNLDLSDDVAHTLWGESWRMPTNEEFLELCGATYWAWDDDDKGYYVYEPQEGDAGKINNNKESAYTYDKTDALLFFSAAGCGYDGNLWSVGELGRYWSSTYSDFYPDNTNFAYLLEFEIDYVDPQKSFYRCVGSAVRPLSD